MMNDVQGTPVLDPVSTGIVRALVNAMEAKSVYLRGHSDRVAATAAAIAAEMGLSDEQVEEIRLAGWLHDVGMIGVRESVLDKPGELTAAELEQVRQHVVMGVNILAPMAQLGPMVRYVAEHHERRDGSGYPRGVTEISLGGRILGAADALDAVTSPRAFRDAMTIDEAFAYMASAGPGVICPEVLPVLGKLVRRGQVLVFLSDL